MASKDFTMSTRTIDRTINDMERGDAHDEQPERTIVDSIIEPFVHFGLHIIVCLAVPITWALSAKAFHGVGHIGLLAIEGSFFFVGLALAMGFIYGRSQMITGIIVCTGLGLIMAMNSATGFYTDELGNLATNAPKYLQAWRTHSLAITPVLSIFGVVIFSTTNGNNLLKIQTLSFWIEGQIADERTTHIEKQAERSVTQADAIADAASDKLTAYGKLKSVQQLKKAVKKQVKSPDFVMYAEEQADELLRSFRTDDTSNTTTDTGAAVPAFREGFEDRNGNGIPDRLEHDMVTVYQNDNGVNGYQNGHDPKA